MADQEYILIANLNGNLTDEVTGGALTTVSGTPSYVTGDGGGNALTISSATVSKTMPYMQIKDQLMVEINVRVNTGYADGVVWTLETDDGRIIMALIIEGGVWQIRSYTSTNTGTQTEALYAVTPDTWQYISMSTSGPSCTTHFEGNSSIVDTGYWGAANWLNGPEQAVFVLGDTINGASPTTPLPVLTAATGVDVDYWVIHPSNENTAYGTVTTLAGTERSMPADGGFSVLTNKPLVLPVETGGGGGPVIKEFWS